MTCDEAFWLRVLGRTRVAYDGDACRQLIDGEVVLITGAGGTIGSELVKACLALGARRVLALDQAEYPLWHVLSQTVDTRLRAVLGSVLDVALLDRLMMLEPAVIFHAAAVKHVGFAERQPAEAARVNVGGAFTIAACDGAAPGCVRKAVMISTDKAAAPTTVMGMTKRVAEAVWTTWGARGVVVRPVNVVGSSGSVGETFAARLAVGQQVEVAAATRMFATAAETAAMVLEAAAWSAPTACIAFPDPAPAGVTIADLAQRIALELKQDGEMQPRALPAWEKQTEILRDESEGLGIAMSDRLMAVANLGDIAVAGEVRRISESGNDRAVREILTATFARRRAA